MRSISARSSAVSATSAAAADRFTDHAVIVTLAIAGRGVEKGDAKIEGAADGGDRLRVVGRTVGARHAVAAETEGRDREIGVAKAAAFQDFLPSLLGCAVVPPLHGPDATASHSAFRRDSEGGGRARRQIAAEPGAPSRGLFARKSGGLACRFRFGVPGQCERLAPCGVFALKCRSWIR